MLSIQFYYGNEHLLKLVSSLFFLMYHPHTLSFPLPSHTPVSSLTSPSSPSLFLSRHSPFPHPCLLSYLTLIHFPFFLSPLSLSSTHTLQFASQPLAIPKELWRLVDVLWTGGALRERNLFLAVGANSTEVDPGSRFLLFYCGILMFFSCFLNVLDGFYAYLL